MLYFTTRTISKKKVKKIFWHIFAKTNFIQLRPEFSGLNFFKNDDIFFADVLYNMKPILGCDAPITF